MRRPRTAWSPPLTAALACNFPGRARSLKPAPRPTFTETPTLTPLGRGTEPAASAAP